MLAGARTFSKLDLRDGNQQVKFQPAAKKLLTSINTHRWLFQYNSLPFGVSSAPAIFQREMESFLSSCKGVVIYFDYTLITRVTEEEHCRNLETVLKKLQEARLKLKLGKCSFSQKGVEYSEHITDTDSLRPGPRKVEAVLDALVPSNVRELQSYLGLLNFCHRFLSNLSPVLHSLHRLLKIICLTL